MPVEMPKKECGVYIEAMRWFKWKNTVSWLIHHNVLVKVRYSCALMPRNTD